MLLAILNRRPWRWVSWGVLLLGVVLRVHDFSVGRSLWLDEVMLARNIVERPPAELLQPLDHNQAAPIGFLLSQKLAVQLLGEREWALRLVPLLLAIWSLFLFARLSSRFVSPAAGMCCLSLFACTPTLVIASNKQYLVDVWAALAMVTLVYRTSDRGHRAWDYVWLGLAGAALVWMSQPAVLVMAATGCTLLLQHARRGNWTAAKWAMLAIVCWLTSFTLNYFAFTRQLQVNEYLRAYWNSGFPPFDSGVLGDAQWLFQAALNVLRLPGRLKPAQLAGVLLGIGGVSLALRSPTRFGILAMPILITLAVAEARLFPFQGRLVLFLLPYYFWLVGVGLDRLLQAKPPVLRGAAIAALLLLLLRPCADAQKLVIHPPVWEEPRGLIAHIAAESQPGDVLYVHPNAVHALAYYRRFYGLSHLQIVHGSLGEASAAETQLHTLRASCRVWTLHLDLMDQACPVRPLTKEQLVGALVRNRQLIDNLAAPGATAMLFSTATGYAGRAP